jgi:hypothetical protein
MKLIQLAGALVATLFLGVAIGQDVKKQFSPVSTLPTEWMKSGTGTTYKMTRVDDPEKKVSCYVLDMAANPVMSCVKE